ncbi:MAG: glycosyltransferase [Gemmatimonadaceae bacterium]
MHRKRDGTNLMISVIVPARNESKIIRQCLSALRAQSLPADQFEIVVVDNGSTDDTVEIAQQFTDRVYSFPGVAVGKLRNSGAKLAQGDVLAFIDADCLASEHWLEGARDGLADGGVAVGNKYDRPADTRWIEALWLGSVSPGRLQTQELWSGNLVVDRASFDACGGFDETLVSYEDVYLSAGLAVRGELYFDDRVRVVHVGGPATLMEFASQQLWHGFEEWTLFARGIKRDTFVPTMMCLVGYALLIFAAFFPTPASWGAFALGIMLIAGASLWRLRIHLYSHPQASWRTVMRLALLNFVSLSARALAVVIRAFRLDWSGRKKSVTV